MRTASNLRKGVEADAAVRNLSAAAVAQPETGSNGRAIARHGLQDRNQRSLPSPTLSSTDPVPRGLLTLCPWASSGPQAIAAVFAVCRQCTGTSKSERTVTRCGIRALLGHVVPRLAHTRALSYTLGLFWDASELFYVRALWDTLGLICAH